MEKYFALSLTLFVGIFFAIGLLLPTFAKKNKKIFYLTLGFAITVMLGMLIEDLIPEYIDIIKNESIFLNIFLIFILFLGIGLFIILDHFIPHHHEHTEKESSKEHNYHVYHIGFITAIPIILHNFLEGISIYTVGLQSFHSALLFSIGVGMHNLPLGAQIGVSISQIEEKKRSKNIIYIFLLFSSFLGACVSALFSIGNLGQEILLVLTIGMILYLLIFELIKEALTYKKEKSLYVGLFCGILLSSFLLLI